MVGFATCWLRAHGPTDTLPGLEPRSSTALSRPLRKVREIAWKAQTRLTARYRTLSGRGKKTTVVCAAVARELAGFMWAVAREASAAGP